MRRIYCYLRGHRRKWSLTQRDLAFLIGSYRARISNVERGKAQPKASELLGYSLIFDCTPQSIFPGYAENVLDRIEAHARQLSLRIDHDKSPEAERKNELIENLRNRIVSCFQNV
jgi:transcriptional regulator with XRE-family HTH domain